jgi:hypothetical protein
MAAAAAWQTIPPPRGRIHHVGRPPDPFYWHTPVALDLEQPSGGRFDDPHGEYATLYCASTAYGALLEKLSPLRPIPELVAQYDSALDDDVDPEFDHPPTGAHFPVGFCDTNVMGTASIDSDRCFLDVEDPENHRLLEQLGGQALLQLLAVNRIDRGTFTANDRALTRRIAREIYDQAGEDIAGLRYLSAIDADIECWAIWDRARPDLHHRDIEPFDLTTPDLRSVINFLGFNTPT